MMPLINNSLLFLILLSIIALIKARTSIGVMVSMTTFSLSLAAIYSVLQAPDVAITEAAIGACLSSVFILAALNKIQENFGNHKSEPNLLIVIFLIGIVFANYDALESVAAGMGAMPEVARYYIANTEDLFGFPNVVTAVLASFRGFDTFGETVVIIIAAVGVHFISTQQYGEVKENSKNLVDHSLKKDRFITYMNNLTFPIIVLLALYVQFHGDYSPGGGFQAGAIIASAFIAQALVFEEKAITNIFSTRALRIMAAAGGLLYGGIGLASVALGGRFLDYSVFFPGNVAASRNFGVIGVELGVGIAVASSMLVIYLSLARGACQS